jgi:molybdopterin-guanine dinucleotide biosynthesis protein B
MSINVVASRLGKSRGDIITMNRTNFPPIISIVGRSKVGKTTFLVKLIAELAGRGHRVGVIKHSVHAFDFAQPGKDTWKHRQAGAAAIAFASAGELAITRQLDLEMSIDEIAATLGDVDLILTEGYKRAHKPKIEVSRRERGTDLVSRREEIIAVVSDHPIALEVPRFGLDDAAGVTALLEAHFLSRAHPGERSEDDQNL